MADVTDTRSNAVLIIVILGSIIASATLAARIYSRHILLHSFGKDDVLMLAGWVSPKPSKKNICRESHANTILQPGLLDWYGSRCRPWYERTPSTIFI